MRGVERVRIQDKERRRRIELAYGVSGPVSSRGLVMSTIMRNRFNSNDVGVVLNLGDNPDELLYIGQVR